MRDPLRDPRLLGIVRRFGWELREYLYSLPTDTDREMFANRFLGAVAAATAVGLSSRRRNDATAAALFAVAVRLWNADPGK